MSIHNIRSTTFFCESPPNLAVVVVCKFCAVVSVCGWWLVDLVVLGLVYLLTANNARMVTASPNRPVFCDEYELLNINHSILLCFFGSRIFWNNCLLTCCYASMVLVVNVCLSVCLSVSHKLVQYQKGSTDQAVFQAYSLPSTYPALCCNKMGFFPKTSVLSSATFPKLSKISR